jgi:transcriptional regulator with PAS, ATPase and Fis domain
MPKAPLPPNELERLADLQSFDILDTPEEPAFDEIARIASIIFDMPIALVSLVDEARQYFKARVGLDATETPRDVAFCAHTILESKVMVVEDAREDERFNDNALVTQDPRIRFYAGAPLVTDAGNRVGTLCLIDIEPRSLTPDQENILQMLANRVISEMKLRRVNLQLRKTRDDVKRLFATLSDGVVAVNAAGEITFIDDKAVEIFSADKDKSLGCLWEDVLKLSADSATVIRELLADGQSGPVSVLLEHLNTEMEIRKTKVPDSPGENALILSDVTELKKMRAILTAETIHYGIVGRAPAMRDIGIQIAQVAPLDIPVMISGETGTGKDLVANAIHKISPRESGPFVAVNCGALTESLLSSQLFGHKRGAFTGATDDQQGLFEAGSGGTVFLDEIGDMPMDLQVNLLRVLDNKEVVRLGETKPRSVDFRLVSASNRDLEQLIREGRFREDLFYRIRGLDIRMPPLRKRREDIPLLLEHFASIDALMNHTEPPRFTNNAIAVLMRYPWPGNVRQLRSVVSFAVLHSGRSTIRLADLPPEISAEQMANTEPQPPSSPVTLKPAHADPKQEILWALEQAQGNRSQAAKLLEISRATFYRRMQQLGIDSKNNG